MRDSQDQRGKAMPARPPQWWGLEQPPPDEGEPTAKAELRMEIKSGEQVTPAPKPVRRITTMMRGNRLGAVLLMAVPPEDASQMIAAIERITVTLSGAAAVTVTLGIATAASLPAGAVIAIIGFGLTGFALTLLATRWRRRRDK